MSFNFRKACRTEQIINSDTLLVQIYGFQYYGKFRTIVLCQCSAVLPQKLTVSQAVKKSSELRVHYRVHKIPSFPITRLCVTFRIALPFAVSNFIGHAQPPVHRPTRCRLPALPINVFAAPLITCGPSTPLVTQECATSQWHKTKERGRQERWGILGLKSKQNQSFLHLEQRFG